MAFSSTPSIHRNFKYDVFLSFRGEDTRKNFIDHLYYALQQKNMNTYKDEEEIRKGKLISSELIDFIQDSKFYIIVFSKNYASSSWCLNELVKIMECHKTAEHTAYPVFYDVKPTEVRWQIGAVREAFAKHENDEDVGKWKEALKEAADLAGWELKKTVNGHEAKFIKKIVEDISLELQPLSFGFEEKLVRMETRVMDVVSYLETDIDDVGMIGIKGMGGGGKTTLARSVFDQMSFQFEGKVFVENVREVSNSSLSGLISLQKQVLSDILNDQGIKISSIYDGKMIMKRRMCTRKVLIVLDDVDDIEQLEALAGAPSCFKPGSRIIITARDEQVLVVDQVKWVLNVNLLSSKEAICLFSKYAFGTEIPTEGYQELSRQVIRYAADLPLTVKVLGSFLCGKNESEWKDALERLKTIPLKETLQKLELNVACILKGWPTDLAIEALESCGFHARNGLRVLDQRSLISYIVSNGSKFLGMHDHIEEMGKNIHPHKPKKHSQLWIDDEIQDTLANDLGTKAIRYIRITFAKVNLDIVMKGLIKMKELRFLDVSTYNYAGKWKYDNGSQYFPDVGTYNYVGERKCYHVSHYFPNALQYLRWYGYPMWSLPNTFHGNNLVALKMPNSKIQQLWEGGERKVLNKLKFLDLSDSKLTVLDLGLIPNLEALSLGRCRDLVQIHLPVDKCLKLTHLHCTGSKLTTLDIHLALNLEKLNLDKSKDLVRLHMPRQCLHLSSLKLTESKLRLLDIGLTPNLVLLNLSNSYYLEELHMAKICQTLTSLNNGRSKLKTLDLRLTPNLKNLDLIECNNLVPLHFPIGGIESLVYLVLSGCLRFAYFIFDKLKDASCRSDESLEVGPLAELHLIAKPLKICPLPLDSTMRKFQIESFYKDDPSSTRNLETLISVGLCACTDHKMFSRSICGLRLQRKLKTEGYPEVPKDLGRLECLEELSLLFKNMEHLPDSICMMKHLKVLKLGSCWSLEKLPKDLGRLKCLETLILSFGKIKHLPNSICMLKHLKFLDLRYCFLLEKLPENLDRLECLEWLELLECKSLRDISVSICEMRCLKRLDLGGTCVSHLPHNIRLLKGLCIKGSRCLLESCGFTSDIQTLQYKDTCRVTM